jgi:PAS domain S-box-containing protein
MTSRSRQSVVERHAQFEPVPHSARLARTFVGEALVAAGHPELADTALLLVSELVTNAIVHARTPIEVVATATADGVYVGVTDTSAQRPAHRDYGTQATTGRGLEMVRLLADRHGTEIHEDGSKTVWFELGRANGAVRETGDEPAPAPDRTAVTVVYQAMPLRLARAWQQHVAALMREYLLAIWELDGDVDARLDEQALAADALADVAAALDAAPQPGADDHVEVTVVVLPEHGERFNGLDRLLDVIQRLPGRDDMLTPRMQPEMRALRRWICSEVRGQLQGRAPQAWKGIESGDVLPRSRPVTWDGSGVHASELAVLAADDANCIIAASPALVALLGWTSDELLGERIVAIIPPRLREHHIAAFSEHLLTGSTTILGRGVNVAALHRDGHEVPVELLIQREPAADGRAVFVATMTPLPAPVA